MIVAMKTAMAKNSCYTNQVILHGRLFAKVSRKSKTEKKARAAKAAVARRQTFSNYEIPHEEVDAFEGVMDPYDGHSCQGYVCARSYLVRHRSEGAVLANRPNLIGRQLPDEQGMIPG